MAGQTELILSVIILNPIRFILQIVLRDRKKKSEMKNFRIKKIRWMRRLLLFI